MFLFVTQFLAEFGRVGHRLLGVVLGHLQLVAVILQVGLDNNSNSEHGSKAVHVAATQLDSTQLTASSQLSTCSELVPFSLIHACRGDVKRDSYFVNR